MKLNFQKTKTIPQMQELETFHQIEKEQEFSEGSPPPSQIEEATHFDNLIGVPETDGTIQKEDGTIRPPQMTREEFHKAFCLVFNVTSSITRLKSLSVDPKDGAALGASEAIYDTAAEIPALNFLLQPGGKWGGRALMVGAFALPMAHSVKEELAQRSGAGAVKKPEDTALTDAQTLSKFPS